MQNGHNDLGRRVFLLAVSLHGEREKDEWLQFLFNVCHLMEMTPVHKPISYDYPVDGKGGTGYTIIQPITESFLALDVWPDHGGAYLFICSCRAFDKTRVMDYLILHQRFAIVDAMESRLNL